jgi:catechol-2,3-dioxygenase
MPFEISSDVARGGARPVARWDGLPVKISHIVLHSPKHKEATQFMIDVLGFRLSDWLGDFMAFLRCNRAHHRIAILPGPPCLNHVAYDMTGLDNTFSYFVTPNGYAVEYTAELEEVDDATWQPKVHKPDQLVMDQWSIGVGGPHTMPQPHPDAGLFQPVEV